MHITFDQSIRLYRLLKSDDKVKVSNILLGDKILDNNKKEILLNSLNMTRRFRNKFAYNVQILLIT